MTQRPVPLRNLPPAITRGRHRAVVATAVALSLLLHAVGLYWLTGRIATAPRLLPADSGRISVVLAPLPAEPLTRPAPEAPRALPPPAKPAVHPPRPAKARNKPQLALRRMPAEPPAMPPLPAAVPPVATVPDDMSSMLEAARKRRAAARLQDDPAAGGEPAAESDLQRANRVVLANVAAAQIGARGTRREQDGGVFQLRHVGLHTAEFLFRGWNADRGRTSSQLVSVDQGSDSDIRIAVVRKMIELIRSRQTEEFIWNSHRLGKELTLSAKPEYTSELQQFLLAEFFPGFIPASRFN